MNYKIERFNESGKLQESSSSSGKDLLKDAILFEAGTHRGKEYTVITYRRLLARLTLRIAYQYSLTTQRAQRTL